MGCLCKYTTEESQIQRILFKFLDGDLEKLHLLLLRRLRYSDVTGESYVDRLDNGLVHLQQIDLILVYLMHWSKDATKVIPTLLENLEFGIRDVLMTVHGTFGLSRIRGLLGRRD